MSTPAKPINSAAQRETVARSLSQTIDTERGKQRRRKID